MKRITFRIISLFLLLLVFLLMASCSLIWKPPYGSDQDGIEKGSGAEIKIDSPNNRDEPSYDSDEPVDDLEDPVAEQEPRGLTKVKISVVGDIMVHNHQLKAAKQADGNYDFEEVFEDIKPYLEEADIAMGNLETTISTDEIGYTAYPRFRSPESLITALKCAGFHVLTTANNHSLDGVEFGVVNTLDKLDEHGILHTGTARSIEERDSILILEKNDIKIGVLAYTYGTNGMEGSVDKGKLEYMVDYLNDTSKIEKDIQRAKEKGAEFIILCAHWGDEYIRTPNQGQKDMAEKLFSMGADVIFGSHAHVIQPMERRNVITDEGQEKEVFVIYSLGNIVSNQRDRYKDSGLILNLEIVKDYDRDTIEIGEIDYIPTWVYRYNKGERLHYRILPVKDFLDADLGASDRQRIKEVWKETTEHLDSEHIKARD